MPRLISVPQSWSCIPAATPRERPGELDRLRRAAALTTSLGLECHAGHGLTFGNVGPVAALPEVIELNIGHFLIGQAIIEGLPAVVSRMKLLMLQARAAHVPP